MKNKSSTSTKTKKKILPPIKAVKKEPIAIKISNKSSNKTVPSIEKKLDDIKIPPVQKSPEQNLPLSPDNTRKKRLSSLPPNVSIKPEVTSVNILEKQKTTLNGNLGAAFNPDSSYQLGNSIFG